MNVIGICVSCGRSADVSHDWGAHRLTHGVYVRVIEVSCRHGNSLDDLAVEIHGFSAHGPRSDPFVVMGFSGTAERLVPLSLLPAVREGIERREGEPERSGK